MIGGPIFDTDKEFYISLQGIKMKSFMTDLSRKKILVVEDDTSIRETMRDILESEGYQVETAVNGRDGLDKMKISPPTLVLLDMRMPVMGGKEFLEILHKDVDLSLTPVLVVSATAKKDASFMAQGLIKKPIDLDALLKMVENHTRKRL